MSKIDANDTAYSGVDELIGFFKFLLDNDLAKGARDHLKSLGVVDVVVSKQAVEAVKKHVEMVLKEKGEITPEGKRFIECICCNAGCRNE